MNWNIAQAKQQFSRLVLDAQHAPQAILKHHDTVAYMLSAQEYQLFQNWRTRTATPDFHASLAQLRANIPDAEDIALALPPRRLGASRITDTHLD